VTPPRAILTYFRPNALLILSPIEVLPTPGGPTKQRTFPFTELCSFPTAINSNILYLTSSNP